MSTSTSKPLSSDQATKKITATRPSLEAGMWRGLADLLAELRRQEETQGVDSRVRGDCINALSESYKKGKPVPLKTFEKWVAEDPNNPDAHLIRGNLLVSAAWNARTAHWAALVTEVQYAIFQNRLNTAEQALQKAIDLDPTDDLPYSYLLTVGMGLGKPKAELWEIFRKFQQHCKDVHSSAVHRTMLYALTPKWGGSLEELLDFAKTSTVNAAAPPPPGHPLWTLMCTAHLYAWEDCKLSSAAAAPYWKDDAVKRDILQAYHGYKTVSTKRPGSTKVDPKTANACRNRFAFCLWKVGAFPEAKREMDQIRNAPTEDPWSEESRANWKQVYERAKGEVQQNSGRRNGSLSTPFEIV